MNSDLLSLLSEWEGTRGHLYSYHKKSSTGDDIDTKENGVHDTTDEADASSTSTQNDPNSFVSEFSTTSFTTVNATEVRQALPKDFEKILKMDTENMPEYPHPFYEVGFRPRALLARAGATSTKYNHLTNKVEVTFLLSQKQHCVSVPVTDNAKTEVEMENVVAFAAMKKLNLFALLKRKALERSEKVTNAFANSKSLILPPPPTEDNNNGQAMDFSSKAAKMMLKMGWAPGTALAEGGLVVPIEAHDQNAREGLGRDSALELEAGFKASVTTLIQEFIRSKEYIMSIPALSNVQRKVVHDVCRPKRLMSKSVGKGEHRVITVSRRGTEEQWKSTLEQSRQDPQRRGRDEEKEDECERGGGAEFMMDYDGTNKKRRFKGENGGGGGKGRGGGRGSKKYRGGGGGGRDGGGDRGRHDDRKSSGKPSRGRDRRQ